MTPLAAARAWYRGVYESALALGAKHWDRLSADEAIRRDNRLGQLDAGELSGWAGSTLDGLDDLAVLLLFSVFEAVVQSRVRDDVAAELPDPVHPALQAAMSDLYQSLEHGSFFRVMAAYKSVDADLVEQVNQVRRYRNWVAHGRRGERPPAVTPQQAYTRLTGMLAVIGPPP